MDYAQRSNVQLYNLVNKLSFHIDHTDYLGTIISYSIIGGLMNFSTNINSKSTKKNKAAQETHEQFKFSEIKSVYAELESILGSAPDKDENVILSNLMSTLDPKINSLFEEEKLYAVQSILLKNILLNIDSQKNYIDILRKRGIRLIDTVKSKKSFDRPYDFLNEDYKSVITAFVPKKYYDYELSRKRNN
jgi:hypothetical protein